MSMLKQSDLRAPCDECRTRFDPTYGGVCVHCNRILCATHLYGALWQRLRGRIGLRAACVKCRSDGSANA